MLRFKKFFLLAGFVLVFLPSIGLAENNPVDLYFFEGQGCPYCAQMKSFLEGLKSDFPNLKVYDFEVYFNRENQALFRKMAEAYGKDTSGVPTIFIDNEVIEGADFEKVKNAVERCSWQVCNSPMDKLQTSNINNNSSSNSNPQNSANAKNEIVGWLVIGAIVVAGLFLIIFYFKRAKAQ